MTGGGPDVSRETSGRCEECISVKINWGQVLTIGLGVTAGLFIAGLAARLVKAV